MRRALVPGVIVAAFALAALYFAAGLLKEHLDPANADSAPVFNSLSCTGTPTAGDLVSCYAEMEPATTVTAARWWAQSGTPSSGTAALASSVSCDPSGKCTYGAVTASFRTTFMHAGSKTVRITACDGSACASIEGDVRVQPKRGH